MAKSAKYYNADDFNNYKRQLGKCVPPRPNVLAAASHIQTLFDAKKFTWGFMGGLAMLCLGYKREMPDLHVAYDVKDFERLKAKLECDPRVRLPVGMNPLLPFKVLVWTGPEYKDYGCTASASIELDLVPPGSCNTPVPSALAKNLTSLALKTSDGQQRTFKCLSIQLLMTTSLFYCKARDLVWDPRKDILYLCKNASAEVQRIRGQLNVKEVKELFLGTPFFSRLSIEDQRLCYRLILDTEPPPTMAITPPAPTGSTSDLDRTSLLQHSDDIRTPRSRYRNAIGQRSSCGSKLDLRTTDGARSQSRERLQDPRQVAQIVSVQCVTAGKPQPVSASSAARRARRSMPDLMGTPDAMSVQQPKPEEANTARLPQQQRGMCQMIPHQLASASSYQKQTRSQLEYGAGFQPVYLDGTKEIGNSLQDLSLDQSTLVSRSDSSRTDPTGTPVQGIQSQKGSLHIVSPAGEEVPRQQYFEDKNAQPRGRLHLVGPEGLYGPPKIAQDVVQAQHQRHKSAPPAQTEPAFLFELDATASSIPTFIAELPARPVTPPLAKKIEDQHHELSSNEVNPGPPNPPTTSASSEGRSLPASLVAGRPGAHRQARDYRAASEDSVFRFSARQTNAYRYSSYAFPSADLEASSPPSEHAAISTYQAYRPFAASDELDYFKRLEPMSGSSHKRNASNDSTASHDSAKLAREYQELINSEEDYNSH